MVDRAGQPLSFLDIQAGTEHTCGRTSDGVVRCWGSNASGEIGDGTRITAEQPTPSLLVCP
jgi:alpha-tubulin suppressor-like RCC1 family protein